MHSLKDVPAEMPSGFELAAIPARADPRDALVSRHGAALADLPQGARIGTASLRRQAQLLAARPDLQIETVRGSVQTRLGKADSGELDAVILAAAGLSRLEIDRGSPLPMETMLPASGQGTLGIEIRAGNHAVAALLAEIEDADARIAAGAERAFCRALGASCAAPVAAYAQVAAGRVELKVRVLAADGSKVLESDGSVTGDSAAHLGQELAAEMLARGAGPLISGVA